VGNTLAFKILIGGLRSYADNFRFFFRISLPWLVICLPVYWLGKDYVVDHPYFDDLGSFDPLSFAVDALLPLFLSIPFASIAVSWHRHILNEVRTPIITFDYAVWWYWWNGVLIALMTALVVTPFSLALFAIDAFESFDALDPVLRVVVGLLAPIAIYIIVFLMVYRLSVKLPAVAIGKLSYGFKESWNDTKGQIQQFLILGTVMTFIAKLVAKIDEAAVEQLPLTDSFIVYYGLISLEPLTQLIFTGLGVSILTYMYAYFAEGREI
jgi:hypothetical protein